MLIKVYKVYRVCKVYKVSKVLVSYTEVLGILQPYTTLMIQYIMAVVATPPYNHLILEINPI